MTSWSDPTLVAWFVARTKPNREDYAERTLRLRQVDVFLPRIVEMGLDAAGRPRPAAPLFPGYLFVHIDLFAEWQRVIWAPGIRDLVCLGGGPIPIDDGVLERLKMRCDERGVAYVAPATWKHGDRVEIDFLARQTSVDLPLNAIKGAPETAPRFVRPAIHA
jgi:transcription antitermination factor NusG